MQLLNWIRVDALAIVRFCELGQVLDTILQAYFGELLLQII